MGVLSRALSGPFSLKAAASAIRFAFAVGGQPVYTDWDHKRAVAYGYKVNPTVYACIRAISAEASTVPWRVEVWRNGEWVPAPEHELQRLINRPLAQVRGVRYRLSRQKLMEAIIVYLHLTGEAPVLLLDEDRNGRPKGLWPIRPDRVTPIEDAQAILAGYRYTPASGAQPIPLQPEDIAYFHFFNPLDQLRGMGSLQPAGRVVDADNAAADWNAHAFQQRLVPDGIISVEQSLDDNQFKRLMDQIRETKMGPRNARQVLLLEAGAKFQQLTVNAVDMDYLGGREHNTLQICQVFRVPPEVIGSAKYKAYNSFQQAHEAFWLNNLIPLLEDLAATFNEEIASRWYGDREDVRLRPDYSDVPALLPILERKTSIAKQWWSMGMPVRVASQRLHMGLPEFSGDDTSYLPAGVLPAGQSDRALDASTPEQQLRAGLRLEVKSMPDLRTADGRAQEWKRREALRQRWEAQLAARVRDQFEQELRDLKRALEDGEDPTTVLDTAIQSWLDEWVTLLTNSYVSMVRAAGEDTTRQLRELAKARGVPERKLDWEFNPLAARIRQWIAQTVGRHVRDILETTRTQIRAVMDQAVMQGWTLTEMVSGLRQVYHDFSTQRAATIARTETVAAMNRGGLFAAEQAAEAGLELEKVWLTVVDGRERDTHAAADGQRRSLNEPFDVGGVRMQHPGDPDAPARETVNCRCAVAYEPRI